MSYVNSNGQVRASIACPMELRIDQLGLLRTAGITDRRVVRIRLGHFEVEDEAAAAVYAILIRLDGQLEVEQILFAHVEVEFAALLQLELAHV